MVEAGTSRLIPRTTLLDKPGRACYPNDMTTMRLSSALVVAGLCAMQVVAANVELQPADSEEGYVARLLINEVPFPGDPLYRNEEDSKRGMFAILVVLDNRIHYIPPGYTQAQIANTKTRDIIDVITAPGQVQDFFKTRDGQFTASRRVFVRVNYLVKIANQGSPGRFAHLLNYAQELAQDYFRGEITGQSVFGSLEHVGGTPVTGRGYAWMTAGLPCEPGGSFVKVPRSLDGLLGANRFYTLRKDGR